ncbi:PilT family ATPase [Caldanaerobacter subterraneus subsp. pacificus DSM 12653]|uniref:PilT family ATPase n=1 Tax=Caldanaerobacter subterraneus subsp. pacificus DSM 12653 TaxID=391606 RepID=B7R698_9THEO|nr:PilT family ATPase [Caldanaerobacter subterraneus subsp. pacificus DSM 12653]
MVFYKIARGVIGILGLALGFELVKFLLSLSVFQSFVPSKLPYLTTTIIYGAGTLIVGIIFYIVSPVFIKWARDFEQWLEAKLQNMPIDEILIGAFGLIIGLIVANLLSAPLYPIFIVGKIVPILLNLFLGYLGIRISLKKKEDVPFVWVLFFGEVLYNYIGVFKKTRGC